MNENTQKKFKLEISEQENGKRIDALCGKAFPEFSRSYFAKHAVFLVNGKPTTYKHKTQTGDKWEIILNTKKLWSPTDIQPWNHKIKILAESDTWAAIEKPIDISVHPSPSEPSQETILNALVHHFGQNLSQNTDNLDGHIMQRPGLIHRLDKPTSGVLLIAKTNKTHRYFQEHWHTRVRKFYTAIVHGHTPPEGIIDAPLARDPHDKTKMKPQKSLKAKEAKTHFWTQESNDKYSLLNVELYTGRTHQIRAHLSSIGYPILGDEKYDGESAERIFLHARELVIPNPDKNGSETKITSQVPNLFIKKMEP